MTYRPFAALSFWEFPERPAVWNDFETIFDNARDDASDSATTRALTFALRSAALETGAIEGLYATTRGITRTIALQGALWEAALDEIGEDVRGHFDAQLEALEYVLDVATTSKPITQAWIRDLHSITCRQQKTYTVHTEAGVQEHQLRLGEYKTDPNHVTKFDGTQHFYCPPGDVQAEMARLVDELSSKSFEALHGVDQAAYAHHSFVSIHPFADGNGRVARALASTYLYRSATVPLVIFSDQQEPYWDALAAADEGETTTFVQFIEDRAMDTMAMVSDRLHEAARSVTAPTAAIESMATAHGGLTYDEVEALGQRLTDQVQQAIERSAEELLPASPIISTTVFPKTGKFSASFGREFHTLQTGGGFTFRLAGADPVPSGADVTPIVGVADNKDERFAFIVLDANRPDAAPLFLRISDLHPALTAAAEQRLRSWAERAFERALADVQRGIEQGLRQKGFEP